MLNLSVVDLIRSNSFGPVRTGQTKSKVLALLGEPDNVLASDNDSYFECSIWKYSGVDFYFTGRATEADVLFLIWYDFSKHQNARCIKENNLLHDDFSGGERVLYSSLKAPFKQYQLKYNVYRFKMSGSYFISFESGAGIHLEEYTGDIKTLDESKISALA